MSDRDSFRRFTFENCSVRGEWVRLDESWQTVLARHPYPPVVAQHLGQALAAVVLLSATIKFAGSLILQARGEGPLHTLVAQATHRRTIRGLAQWRGEVIDGPLSELLGTGYMVLTLQREGREPYQGIVGLEGENLAQAIERYFAQSEQLTTRLWLAADGYHAAGLLLQELPARGGTHADWERILCLADTLTCHELLHLPAETLLYRLFHEEQVRLHAPEPVTFHCGCSRERIATVLRALGREELETILKEHGKIEIDCEFCNHHYHFDAIDAYAALCAHPSAPSPDVQH